MVGEYPDSEITPTACTAHSNRLHRAGGKQTEASAEGFSARFLFVCWMRRWVIIDRPGWGGGKLQAIRIRTALDPLYAKNQNWKLFFKRDRAAKTARRRGGIKASKVVSPEIVLRPRASLIRSFFPFLSGAKDRQQLLRNFRSKRSGLGCVRGRLDSVTPEIQGLSTEGCLKYNCLR